MENQTQNLQMAPQMATGRLQSLVLIAVIVLFCVSLIWGIFSGISYGKSQATYQQVDDLNTALHYYFQDQGRYPNADQFFTQKILTPYYMSAMPKPEANSGACSSYADFAYSQTSPQNFSLMFCLTSGVKGLSAGEHILTEQTLQ